MPRVASSILIAVAVAVAAAGGCDGEGESASDSEGPAPPAGARGSIQVAALGDSITAGSPLYDPDPDARAQFGFGDDERSQFEYWAADEDPKLEFSNCGVFGERTEEIAARLEECAAGADVLIVQGGINDIAQALGGGPEAALDAVTGAATNIEGMIAEGQELGLDVVVVNVLPWNNGHPVADEPINRLNADIADNAKRKGVPLIDFHDALEDPDEAGLMAPEFTDDGDHPSIEGYKALGELVAAELANLR